MIYTIAKLREYARGLDERLSDTANPADSWIDERIEDGISLAQDLKPYFSTTEAYDLSQNIEDGLTTVEIILQKEVHSVHDLTYSTEFFTATISPNNHIIVTMNPNVADAIDKTIRIRYFFYPTLPITEIELSVEMFKLVKATIASNCYSFLSDEDNEKLYLDKAHSIIATGTFDTEKDMLKTPDERLWRGSWV